MRFAPIALLLCACSFAGATEPLDEPVALHVQPHELDDMQRADLASFAAVQIEDVSFQPAPSVVQAQLDAEAMLDDVRAAHDAEARQVLREREDIAPGVPVE